MISYTSEVSRTDRSVKKSIKIFHVKYIKLSVILYGHDTFMCSHRRSCILCIKKRHNTYGSTNSSWIVIPLLVFILKIFSISQWLTTRFEANRRDTNYESRVVWRRGDTEDIILIDNPTYVRNDEVLMLYFVNVKNLGNGRRRRRN